MRLFSLAIIATFFRSRLEAHPSLGWIGSLGATGTGFWVLIEHATRIVGLVSVLIGLLAGIYTLRIQKRTWDTGQNKTQPKK